MSLHLLNYKMDVNLNVRSGLFHIAIKLPQISDLANLLIHLSEYDIPVNEVYSLLRYHYF